MNELLAKKPRKPKNLVRHFIVAMFAYLCIVHGWSLYLYPLGHDFHAFSDHGVPHRPAEWLLALERVWFGTFLPGYHAVNLLLLYGCMVSVFFLTRFALNGPWWLGSLAATMMMANPLKSDAALSAAGVLDLLPAFLSLGALVFYAAYVEKPRVWKLAVALLLFAATSTPANCALFLIMALYEFLVVPRGKRRWLRLIPFLLAALVILYWEPLKLPPFDWTGAQVIGPALLIFYPIGFLPETAYYLQGPYGLSWLALLIVCGATILLYRMLRVRGFMFGLAGAFAACLFGIRTPVDLVHMIGGGQLLVPIALANIAFAAVCMRISDHPKWRRPVVQGTTILCMILFALQIREIQAWRHAGNLVREFQHRAADMAKKVPDPDTSFGILPHYLCHRTAPIFFRASCDVKGLFSEPIYNGAPMLNLAYSPEDPARLVMERQDLKVTVTAPGRLEDRMYYAPMAQPGDRIEDGLSRFHITLKEKDADSFVVEVTPGKMLIPENILGVPLP